MANPYLILWCDPTQNKIYSGWQKNTQASTPVLKQGDEIGCEIHWVKTGEYTANMQEIAFPPSATVRLAVGRLDSAPLGGTFTITYGANTTPALAYNIEATALQTALNALASIAAEGGVTVTKSGNQYRIAWNNVGAYTTPLTASVGMLYPTSQYISSQVREGTATVTRGIIFKTKQSVMAGTTSFTAVPDPSITVSTIFANNWRVSIAPNPKEGVFSLSVVKGPTTYNTVSIPSTADALTVATALNNLNVVTGQTFEVIKSGDFVWDITAPSAVDSMSATSGLVGFSAMYGVLDMNTAEVEEFLAGVASGEAYLEVEVDVAGEIQTLVQTRVRVINDLIDVSSFNVVNMGDVMPVDSVVRYDTSQALTTAQQETARLNIDAVSLAEVNASLSLGNLPTNNEKAAMQYSVLPSQTNPFVTESEIVSYDQSLNTTDDVQFNTVTVGTGTVVIDNDGITFPDDTVQTTAAIIPDLSAYVQKASNLSDLASAATARNNLGLGTMAVQSASNYLTISAASSDYLSKSGNLSGLADISTARTNLGLGTIATASSSDYLAKSENLSGLTNTLTARNNIGLGTTSSPQFSTINIGGTSGNYSSISGTSLLVNSTTSGSAQVGPASVTLTKPADSTTAIDHDSLSITAITGYATTIEATSIQTTSPQGTAKINKDGDFKIGEKGVWYGDAGGQTGITAEGVRFPDGSLQTTAGASGHLKYDLLGQQGWNLSNQSNESQVEDPTGVAVVFGVQRYVGDSILGRGITIGGSGTYQNNSEYEYDFWVGGYLRIDSILSQYPIQRLNTFSSPDASDPNGYSLTPHFKFRFAFAGGLTQGARQEEYGLAPENYSGAWRVGFAANQMAHKESNNDQVDDDNRFLNKLNGFSMQMFYDIAGYWGGGWQLWLGGTNWDSVINNPNLPQYSTYAFTNITSLLLQQISQQQLDDLFTRKDIVVEVEIIQGELHDELYLEVPKCYVHFKSSRAFEVTGNSVGKPINIKVECPTVPVTYDITRIPFGIPYTYYSYSSSSYNLWPTSNNAGGIQVGASGVAYFEKFVEKYQQGLGTTYYYNCPYSSLSLFEVEFSQERRYRLLDGEEDFVTVYP